MTHDPIVIVAAARTPMGAFQGVFKDTPATTLGAASIKAAVSRAGIPPEKIDEVIMGCVLPAGLGQAPARQALLEAGLPEAVGATTINKMCGSGMRAVMLAHDQIMAGSSHVMVAGGMENMSNAPHLLSGSRKGFRMGNAPLIDHMFRDGLEDAYERGTLMGVFADRIAAELNISRAVQDDFALTSLTRASTAIKNGWFADEITSVQTPSRQGVAVVDEDESPAKADPAKIPTLKPAFSPDGTVTAANASSISDGAAALVLMRRSTAEQLGCPVLATIMGHATHASTPSRFATAPIGSIEKLCDRIGWELSSVDAFEINEAFAVVTLAAMQALALPHEKVNIHGGACALGHPIGASGARILVTLLSILQRTGGKRGVASLCIGGGEATAIALER
jgi:acetyl-CoA C-acetyltransferase